MALPADAARLLLALFQAKKTDREVNLSALAAELRLDTAGMLQAFTTLDRYQYARRKGVGSEVGLPYPLQAELTRPGILAAEKLAAPGADSPVK